MDSSHSNRLLLHVLDWQNCNAVWSSSSIVFLKWNQVSSGKSVEPIAERSIQSHPLWYASCARITKKKMPCQVCPPLHVSVGNPMLLPSYLSRQAHLPPETDNWMASCQSAWPHKSTHRPPRIFKGSVLPHLPGFTSRTDNRRRLECQSDPVINIQSVFQSQVKSPSSPQADNTQCLSVRTPTFNCTYRKDVEGQSILNTEALTLSGDLLLC